MRWRRRQCVRFTLSFSFGFSFGFSYGFGFGLALELCWLQLLLEQIENCDREIIKEQEQKRGKRDGEQRAWEIGIYLRGTAAENRSESAIKR